MSDGLYGIYRGIVRDVDDPEGRSRVRVEVPSVFGPGGLSGWAWPSNSVNAALPDLGSVIYIAFEAGNAETPVWFSGGGGDGTGTGVQQQILQFTKVGNIGLPPLTGDFMAELPGPGVITKFIGRVGYPALGSDIQIDLLINAFDGGGSVLGAPLVIPAGSTGGRTDVSSFAYQAEDYLTVNVIEWGSSYAGADLVAEVGVIWGGA